MGAGYEGSVEREDGRAELVTVSNRDEASCVC